MNAVAIVPVVLSTLLALAAIVAGVWQQERAIADRQSVRSILADTATVLHRAEYAVDEVHLALSGHALTMFDPDYLERAESVPRLEAVGRELDQAFGLLKVELGPVSSATEAPERAIAGLLAAYRAIRTIRFRHRTASQPIARFEEANEKRKAGLRSGRDEFKAAGTRFVERAHAIARTQVPQPDGQQASEQPSGVR